MALYKNAAKLTQSNDAAFDKIHGPADTTPLSGIYRCEGCGHEAVSTEGHPLPPQNHTQHIMGSPVQWKLVVFAQHNK
jgi:hypothetical protein